MRRFRGKLGFSLSVLLGALSDSKVRPKFLFLRCSSWLVFFRLQGLWGFNCSGSLRLVCDLGRPLLVFGVLACKECSLPISKLPNAIIAGAAIHPFLDAYSIRLSVLFGRVPF